MACNNMRGRQAGRRGGRARSYRFRTCPIAVSIERALFSVSSHSFAGIESATMPAPAWIDATVSALGIEPATCLTDSYGRLFLTWKQRTGSPVDHLTFDQIPAPELLQPALR